MQGEKHIGKIDLELGKRPQEPVPVRYRTNDTTYQALAELIVNNPTGILVERDELVSLLRDLDRHDQAVARGFFLTGWSGTQLCAGHRKESVCGFNLLCGARHDASVGHLYKYK